MATQLAIRIDLVSAQGALLGGAAESCNLITDNGDVLATDTGDQLIYGGQTFNLQALESGVLSNVITSASDFVTFQE